MGLASWPTAGGGRSFARRTRKRADKAWLPRALAVGLKRFAIDLPTSVLAAMNVQDRLGKVPSATLDIAYFEGVDEARAWLTR